MPLVPICPKCGSPNVTRDALTRWCATSQSWEISGLLDCTNCDDCDGDEVSLEDVDWPEWLHYDDDARAKADWPFYVIAENFDPQYVAWRSDGAIRDPRAVQRGDEWRVYFETFIEAINEASS